MKLILECDQKKVKDKLNDFEEKKLKSELAEERAKRNQMYRKYAQLDECTAITEDNLDEYALNRTSCLSNFDVNKLKEELLGSALTEASKSKADSETVIDAANKLGQDKKPIIASKNGVIEDALDLALDRNLDELDYMEDDPNHRPRFQNVLLIGEAGAGKTARVKAWARKNNINLVTKLASVMDQTDLGGAPVPDANREHIIRLSTKEMDALERPRSVLFLDEYNRAIKAIRGTLLTLINDHEITDKESTRFIPNFLFTVAAINPADENYDTDEIDTAENDRWSKIYVPSETPVTLQHYIDDLDKCIASNKKRGHEDKAIANEGRKQIAITLLNNPEFKFSSGKEIANAKEAGSISYTLSPRGFENLLVSCDGTKDDFLDKWDRFCDGTQKKKIALMLKDYVDVKDKANDAIKGETKSNVFGKSTGFFDKVAKFAKSQGIDID